MKKMILGSQSPRRKDLLSQLEIDFQIRVSHKNEPMILAHEDPQDYVLRVCHFKGKELLGQLEKEEILITADTIVVRDKDVLGKPLDRKEAMQVLMSLSARSHEVLTGVCLWDQSGILKEDVISTEVTFKKISESEISRYLDLGTYRDKAGSYGIQDIGKEFVQAIRGDLNNVIGLPIIALEKNLKELFGNDWRDQFDTRQ